MHKNIVQKDFDPKTQEQKSIYFLKGG